MKTDTLDGIKSRLDRVEEKISEYENIMALEPIQNEKEWKRKWNQDQWSMGQLSAS